VLLAACLLSAAPAAGQTLSLINVPYVSQSEALCGGAAAAMVLRYWGAQGLTAESFAGLVDRSAAGIRTEALRADLVARGWSAVATEGSEAAVVRELDASRPVIALVEDRPGTYHYVVIVGWHARGVVLHDPARVPYRVMAVQEFRRRWHAANDWMLAVTPGPGRATEAAPARATALATIARPTEPLSCEGLVARGVAEAQANALDAAEQSLTSALGCPGSAALRELAGLRALQSRWPEVIELASRVVLESPGDAYAWQLLATARFVTSDARGALAAWNATSQPRLDLTQVEGLRRTRQRIVERLTSLERGDEVTLDRLRRIERQLDDWPAMTSVSVSYVPKPGGLADLRIAANERDLVPRSRVALGVIGGRAIITREVRVALGPMTSGGDRLELGWRFWPERPRYSAGLLAPAPWGGLWGVQVSSERQPLTAPAVETFRHDSAGVVLSAWQTGRLRWQAGGGIDRWIDRGRFATFQATLDLATLGDGVRLRARGQSWLGTEGFSASDASLRGTRVIRAGRYRLEGRVAASRVSAAAPYDIWPAGDTGHARTTLLRAHPLLTRGKYRTSRLGEEVVTASLEAQRVWRRRGAEFGPAVFTDVGRTARRLTGDPIRDADVGLGFRVRVLGLTGTIRVDLAKGLRDGARALSFVYEP
jgi:predicted double-glycine peptidase